MKIIGKIVVLLCAGLLLFFTSDFPDFGDSTSPASIHLSPYFIEHTIADTAVPNVVTSVLADYRGYDTMFETTVILTAGLACFLLLRILNPEVKHRHYRHEPTGVSLRVEGDQYPEESSVFKRIDSTWVPDSLVLNFVCRLLIPFIQIYALYVVAHGHYSPGGGFQGGVILAASVILFAMTGNLRSAVKKFGEKTAALFGVVGVFIYAGTAALCMVLGENFINYSALAPLLHTDKIMARSHGIFIVEIGVAVAVMAVMIWIYYNLSSAGKQDEGL